MSLENFNYRTDPMFLRDQFTNKGKHGIPILPKFNFSNSELKYLLLVGFDVAKTAKDKNFDRMVHFFLYDYKFESIWNEPEKYVEALRNYKAILTPDFSMYTEMPSAVKIYNTFRNRWCGCYLFSKGIRVIPTVSWGNEDTFNFYFEGIQKGSVVAVSTYMVQEHERRKAQKEIFMKGYNEMLRRINPSKIICYNTPFPEMTGNIIFVDYDLSSWKYRNSKDYEHSKYADYICGKLHLPENCGIIVKRAGYVLSGAEEKGMGSAFGGGWQPSPNKPEDWRLVGEPGSTNTSFYNGPKGGYKRETFIGNDGKATKETHFTDHDKPNAHSDPHDHPINWSGGYPNFGSPINDFGGNKFYNVDYSKGDITMDIKNNIIQSNTPEQNSFKTIDEFKWSMKRGGELQIEYNKKIYFVGLIEDNKWEICRSHRKGRDGKYYKLDDGKLLEEKDSKEFLSIEKLLDYEIDEKKLREIVKDVTVWDRTI